MEPWQIEAVQIIESLLHLTTCTNCSVQPGIDIYPELSHLQQLWSNRVTRNGA